MSPYLSSSQWRFITRLLWSNSDHSFDICLSTTRASQGELVDGRCEETNLEGANAETPAGECINVPGNRIGAPTYTRLGPWTAVKVAQRRLQGSKAAACLRIRRVAYRQSIVLHCQQVADHMQQSVQRSCNSSIVFDTIADHILDAPYHGTRWGLQVLAEGQMHMGRQMQLPPPDDRR